MAMASKIAMLSDSLVQGFRFLGRRSVSSGSKRAIKEAISCFVEAPWDTKNLRTRAIETSAARTP